MSSLDIADDGQYYHLNGGILPSSRTNLYNTAKDTVSISEGGNSCGFVNWNSEPFFSGGHNFTLQKLSGKVRPFFLYQALKYKQNEIMALRVGSGLPNIQKKDLEMYQVCYPTKKEQEQIEAFFRYIDLKAKKQQQLVESLKKYKRGAVSRLLNGTLAFNDCPNTETGQLKRIGDFCEVQMCKRVFKEQTTPDGDVPFYKIGTIGGLPDAYISRSLYEEYKRKYSFPRKGEFLISCAGTVGKCVLYDGEDAYYQDSNIVWLRNNSPEVSNDYLYILVSNVDWATLNSTTITRIYNDNLRELSFYIPPLQMQKRIADYIFALSSRIEAEQKLLAKLQQEKVGLLQHLFI